MFWSVWQIILSKWPRYFNKEIFHIYSWIIQIVQFFVSTLTSKPETDLLNIAIVNIFFLHQLYVIMFYIIMCSWIATTLKQKSLTTDWILNWLMALIVYHFIEPTWTNAVLTDYSTQDRACMHALMYWGGINVNGLHVHEHFVWKYLKQCMRFHLCLFVSSQLWNKF